MEGVLTLSAYTEWSPRFFCWTSALSLGVTMPYGASRSNLSPYTETGSIPLTSRTGGRGSARNLLSALSPRWFYQNAVMDEPAEPELGSPLCHPLKRLQIKGARWDKEMNERIYSILRRRYSLGAPPLELHLSLRYKGPRRVKLFHDALATFREQAQPLVRSLHYVLET
ncbi:hypothetical protein C8Q73DRAFT_789479 [Cubamyces lactineus]|nr:hypothetical protein C8Q73DRAFT_789479 [Cubamyces lactineus]